MSGGAGLCATGVGPDGAASGVAGGRDVSRARGGVLPTRPGQQWRSHGGGLQGAGKTRLRLFLGKFV